MPVQSPVANDHERTVACLEDLAASRTELADVRPGPLGTLDVYVFADGTTLCMTPGHRETAERLAAALHAGETPVLLGGSGISGAYALTFECGDEKRLHPGGPGHSVAVEPCAAVTLDRRVTSAVRRRVARGRVSDARSARHRRPAPVARRRSAHTPARRCASSTSPTASASASSSPRTSARSFPATMT